MRTPTPYRVGRPGTVVADSEEGITISGATGPENVGHYGGNLIAESVSEENAEFIVTACNMHDSMAKSLRDLVAMQGCTTCQDFLPCESHGNITELLEYIAVDLINALNQQEGETTDVTERPPE